MIAITHSSPCTLLDPTGTKRCGKSGEHVECEFTVSLSKYFRDADEYFDDAPSPAPADTVEAEIVALAAAMAARYSPTDEKAAGEIAEAIRSDIEDDDGWVPWSAALWGEFAARANDLVSRAAVASRRAAEEETQCDAIDDEARTAIVETLTKPDDDEEEETSHPDADRIVASFDTATWNAADEAHLETLRAEIAEIAESRDCARRSAEDAWRREQAETRAARGWFRKATERQAQIDALTAERDEATSRATAWEQAAKAAMREKEAECERLRAERDEAAGAAALAIARADEYVTRSEAVTDHAEAMMQRVSSGAHNLVNVATRVERERIANIARAERDKRMTKANELSACGDRAGAHYEDGRADALTWLVREIDPGTNDGPSDYVSREEYNAVVGRATDAIRARNENTDRIVAMVRERANSYERLAESADPDGIEHHECVALSDLLGSLARSIEAGEGGAK